MEVEALNTCVKVVAAVQRRLRDPERCLQEGYPGVCAAVSRSLAVAMHRNQTSIRLSIGESSNLVMEIEDVSNLICSKWAAKYGTGRGYPIPVAGGAEDTSGVFLKPEMAEHAYRDLCPAEKWDPESEYGQMRIQLASDVADELQSLINGYEKQIQNMEKDDD